MGNQKKGDNRIDNCGEDEEMIIIAGLAEDERKCILDASGSFADNLVIEQERGFDAATTVQVVINVADILEKSIPLIVGIVEAILAYRISKQQNDIQKKLADLESENASRTALEVHYSSDGDTQYIFTVNDLMEHPEEVEHKIAELQEKLKEINKKSRKKGSKK